MQRNYLRISLLVSFVALTIALAPLDFLKLWQPSSAQTPPANVNVSIDFNNITNIEATNKHYGTNAYSGMFADRGGEPGNSKFKDNVNASGYRFVRYHTWEMMRDANQRPGGWLINGASDNPGWDENRVRNVLSGMLGAGKPWEQATIVMNIPGWPDGWKQPGNSKLRTDRYNQYADWCNQLVDIVRGAGYDITYWEITNERDDVYGDNMAELAAIYNTVVNRIKASHSGLKFGGAAFARSTPVSTRVKPFLQNAHHNIDFVSYHTYVTGDVNKPNAEIWNTANGLGWNTALIKQAWAEFDSRQIEFFHNEYNINWSGYDPRVENASGAIFDAIAMRAIVKAGASGANAWNDADGWFGKLNSNFDRRPSSYLYELFNKHLVGTVVFDNSSDESAVIAYAVKNSSKQTFALINRSGGEQPVALSLTGLLANTATVYQVTDAGLTTENNVSLGTLTSGSYILPTNSITVVVLNTNVSNPPSAPINKTIAFKASVNGKYVSTCNTAYILIANRSAVGSCEKFRVLDAGDGKIFFKSSSNNKYVTAEDGGNLPLVANRNAAGDWEKFEWIDLGNGKIALKCALNGKYVTAENAGTSALIANRGVAKSWEQFEITVF